MEGFGELLHRIYDVETLVAWGGLSVVAVIVFAETGLLAGFFLPGDSQLVTAGIFAAAGHLDLEVLLVLVSLCAVAGTASAARCPSGLRGRDEWSAW